MAAVVIVIAIGFLLHAHALINRDEAWLLIAAQRMQAGGSYLQDFFEVNMPLAIAVYIPAGRLALWLHQSQQFGITLYVIALSVQSAALSSRVLTAGPKPVVSQSMGPLFMAWVLFGLLCLPGADFGQKEHLIAILTLPFVCSMVNVEALINASAGLRGYCALLAAVGFYLKPHYAALPFLLLGGVGWQQRSWGLLRSVEAKVLVVAGFTNAVWVIDQYPDWFICAQWATDLYVHFGARHWQSLFRIDGLTAVAAGLLTQCLAWVGDRERRRTLAPLLIASGYSGIIYLLQFKAWTYQALVMQLFVFVSQGVLMALFWPRLRTGASTKALATLVACGAALLVDSGVRAIRRQPSFSVIVPIAKGLYMAHPGDTVYAFSTEVAPVFPAVPVLGLKWASRYSALWPLLELARVENGFDTVDRDRFEHDYRQPFVDSVIGDFQRYRPDYVLVDRRNFDVLPAGFDILSMFLADPRFAAIWSGYRRVGIVSLRPSTYDYDVYRRVDGGTAP